MNVHQSNLMRGMMLIGGELVDERIRRMARIDQPRQRGEARRRAAGHGRRRQPRGRGGGSGASGLGRARAEGARQAREEARAKLREQADEILRVEVVDTGNTISQDARRRRHRRRHARLLLRASHTEIKGETIPASAKNLHFTIREPYGVVGRIIPFNHPIKFAANALAAPLMAGNCVVLKPPETSPLSATMLGEICREVLPAGVVNIVTGLGMPAGDAHRAPPERQAHRVHRLGADRPRHPARGSRRRHQARHARTRRQEPADRVSRHGPRQGGGDRGRRHELRLAGPELRLDQPAAAARVALQAGARARGRARGRAASSAIRSTTSRRWGRSTPSATTSASSRWWSPASPTAPS